MKEVKITFNGEELKKTSPTIMDWFKKNEMQGKLNQIIADKVAEVQKKNKGKEIDPNTVAIPDEVAVDHYIELVSTYFSIDAQELKEKGDLLELMTAYSQITKNMDECFAVGTDKSKNAVAPAV